MTIKEELTARNLEETMQKIRQQFPEKEIIVSDRKTIYKHRIEGKKEVNPFTDTWLKGRTWIDNLMLSSHSQTGYAKGSN